jgi:hypothetical protein
MVDDGYEIHAVLDASGSPYEVSEQAARIRMANAGVVLSATNTAIAELAHDWSTPVGQELLKLMFKDVLPTIVPPVSALRNILAGAIHKG